MRSAGYSIPNVQMFSSFWLQEFMIHARFLIGFFALVYGVYKGYKGYDGLWLLFVLGDLVYLSFPGVKGWVVDQSGTMDTHGGGGYGDSGVVHSAIATVALLPSDIVVRG